MALSSTMEAALTQFQETKSFSGYSKSTVKALEARGLIQRKGDDYILSDAPLSESIGNMRPQLSLRYHDRYSYAPTYDGGTTDYVYWDNARWCKAKGLELAGLFLKPLASKKAAWVLGMLPKVVVDDKYTQDKLSEWLSDRHSDILRGFEEAVNLGDCYLVTNSDLTVTVVPPNVVRPLVDDEDYSRIVGWGIREVYQHPERPGDVMTISDDYTDKIRIRIIIKNNANPKPQRYPNLIDKAPVTHIANNRGADERFGHAEGEALINALQYYGELFAAAVVGNRKQGRPTGVIEQMGTTKEIKAFWEQFGKRETRTLPDGTTETYTYLELSSDDILTLGGNATFKWAQPGSFTSDTEVLLGLIFYLILQHTEIPEFVWGNAIASSKASAESQMPPFVKWVEKEQGRVEYWLLSLLDITYRYLQLVDSKIKPNQKITLKWMPLTTQDDKLTLEAIKLALDKGLLDDETALSLMPLDIENPREVLDKLKAQMQEEADEFDRRQEALIDRTAREDTDNEPEADDEAVNESIVSAAMKVIQEQHTGVMVGFFLNGQGKRLYQLATRAGLENVTPSEDMHLTLAFLGDMNDMSQDADKLVEVLTQFAEQQQPITGWLGGVGRFNTDQGDGTTPIYATFDSPDLPTFRQALVEALEAEEITVSRDHGFIPHITLSYLDKDVAMPNIDLPANELTFSKLILAWGDDRREIELTGEAVTA